MSEEGNKNARTMHKGSVKALQLPSDLAALSLSSDSGDEYCNRTAQLYEIK
jgi:hypothetical protein